MKKPPNTIDQFLPGTEQQQEILATIIAYYRHDERIAAIVLFGSLGRGNWDAHSDLDLDIVIQNQVSLNVAQELAHLCAVIMNQHDLDAIIIADDDAGDVVLSNLVEFSIRYHPLETTKSVILDSMLLVAGPLSAKQIKTAGEANRRPHEQNLNHIVNQCVRYTVGLHKAILRRRLWMSLELLHRIRLLMMQVYSIVEGGERPLQFFDKRAHQKFPARLQKIVVPLDLPSLQTALFEVTDILEHDLETFSGGLCQLNNQQHQVLRKIREINWNLES